MPKAEAFGLVNGSQASPAWLTVHEMTTRENGEVLYEGNYLRLVRRGRWEFVERTRCTGVAVLVAVTDENELLLVEQLRLPLRRRVIELPAGLVGDIAGSEDEGMEVAARRELLEETGYEAPEIEFLTEGPISAGLSTENITFFLARGAKQVAAGGGDDSEDITVHVVPLAEVGEWLRRKEREGFLVDTKVFSGIYFAARQARDNS